MALMDKNIVITPNIGQTTDPKIVFTGATETTGPRSITLRISAENSGTLFVENSSTALLSISNTQSGTIFLVNNASGLPSIRVDSEGLVTLTSESTGTVFIESKTISNSTVTGALVVAGGLGVQGDIWARNIYTNGQIVGGASSTSTNLSGGATGSIPYQTAPGATSFIGIGSAGSVLVSNGTTASWTGTSAILSGLAVTATNVAGGLAGWIPIQKANSQTSYITSGSSGQLLMMGVNTASWANTSSITVNQAIYAVTATDVANGLSGQLLYQVGPGDTGFVSQGTSGTVLVSGGTQAPQWQNTLILTGNTPATSTTSGAFQVVGGVGVGGNLWVGGTLYASISGSITTATNLAGGATGGIPYQSSVGTTRFIGIGANGSLLQSNGTTSSWVTTGSIVVGAANISASSSAIAGGSAGAIPYQTGPGDTRFIGIGANGTLLISNGSTATWTGTLGLTVGAAIVATTATHVAGGANGSILVQTAAGRSSFLSIGAVGAFLQSNGTTPQWISTGSALVGTALNINGGLRGQILYQEASGVTKFIGTGTEGSILQMGATTASFVSSSTLVVGRALFANSSTLAGDIARNPTGGGALIYQAGLNDTRILTTGTAGQVLVSRPGFPVFESTLSLTTMFVVSTEQSVSTSSGALQVTGGVGIGGNLWVGGTLYASVSGGTSTSTNLAGGAAGAIAYQSAPGTTTFLNPSAAAGPLLQSNGTGQAPSYITTQSLFVGRSTNAIYADDLTGGANGSIPYQTAANATSMLSIGSVGTILAVGASNTPIWTVASDLAAGSAFTATHVKGGGTGSIVYQSAVDRTTFLSAGTTGQLLVQGASAPTWVSTSSFLVGNAQLAFNLNGGAANRIPYQTAANTTKFLTEPTVTNTYLRYTGSAIAWEPLLITGTTSTFFIDNNTNAVSTTTGALQVRGGAGIGWDVWIGGIVNINKNLTVTGSGQIDRLGIGTAPSANTGEIRATGMISAYYSDKRLKENIEVIPNALDKVMSLRGVTFNANSVAETYGYSTETQVGVIAQEVEAVLPQIVHPAPFDIDVLEDGTEVSKSGNNYKTVDYEKLVPLLIEAIKELNIEVRRFKELG